MNASSQPRAPRARESARQAFRTSLLGAAEQVFVTKGFVAAKMTDIAGAAGVAVGTLYNYFDSKEEIFGEVLTFRGAELRAALEGALEPQPPSDYVTTIVRTLLEYLDEHGAFFALWVDRGGVAEYDLERLGGEVAQAEYERLLDVLLQALSAAVEAGALRSDIPVRTLVAALSGMLNGAAYAWLAGRRRDRLATMANDLLQLFLAGARA
jgi:AcrR family transcriptional regulator